MPNSKTIVAIFLAIALLGDFSVASAAVMSSSNYKIQIDSVNVGGGYASSTSYVFESTAGETGTDKLTGTSNNLYAGFQLPVVAATPTPSPTPAGAGVSSAGTRRAQGQLLNVGNFTAEGANQQIQLRWKNPQDIDFDGVRIMRSEVFYPSSPLNGVHIYSGSAESFLDRGLQNGQRYYYTAFAYDRAVHFASGAIASAIPFDSAQGKPPMPSPEPPLVPKDQIPPELRDLSLLDFDFIQEGLKLPVANGRVEIKSNSPFMVSIDYGKLPEVLKTILVTMEDYEGKAFSFLLRVDEEKKRYLATLNPPASGLYPLTFVIVDYQNQGLQKVEGELTVKEAVGGQITPPSDRGFRQLLPELLVFLLLALLLIAVAKLAQNYMRNRHQLEIQMPESK